MLTKEETKKIKITLNNEDDRLPLLLNALGDRGRLRIFQLLMERKGLCVTEIANVFSLTVSAVSQQLRTLELVGLVRKERMGQMICYEIRKEDPLVCAVMKLIQVGNNNKYK